MEATMVRNTMSVYDKYEKFKKGYLELKFNNKEWFNDCEFFTIYNNIEYKYLHIKKHYIDIPKGARNNKKGRFGIFAEIPLGNYEIDEDESTQDELIIYYN